MKVDETSITLYNLCETLSSIFHFYIISPGLQIPPGGGHILHAFVQSLATAITTAITIIVSVGIVINKNTAVEEVRVPSGTLQRPWWLKAGGVSRTVC